MAHPFCNLHSTITLFSSITHTQVALLCVINWALTVTFFASVLCWRERCRRRRRCCCAAAASSSSFSSSPAFPAAAEAAAAAAAAKAEESGTRALVEDDSLMAAALLTAAASGDVFSPDGISHAFKFVFFFV